MQSHGARILPSTHIYIYVYLVHFWSPKMKKWTNYHQVQVMVVFKVQSERHPFESTNSYQTLMERLA